MANKAAYPQNMEVWMVLENTTSGLTGLSALGPLYDDTTEGTLVQVKRITRFDWGAFEEMFEEIATTDQPHNLRAPLRDNAQLTVEVVAFDDDSDTELSAAHLLAGSADWSMGVTKDSAGAAEYNFLDDEASSKSTDLVGWAVEVVQYDDSSNVLWRRRIHNCKMDVKPIHATGGKPARVELTFSDARYIDQDTTDVSPTHSDS